MWDLASQPGSAVPKAQVQMESRGPLLDVEFGDDDATCFAAGCDAAVRLWNPATNAQTVVARHEAPIKAVFWVKEHRVIVTGGWDRNICVWDCQSATPKVRRKRGCG